MLEILKQQTKLFLMKAQPQGCWMTERARVPSQKYLKHFPINKIG